MAITLEDYPVPEQGPVEINVNLAFEIKVTAYQAKRKVNRWVLEYVSVIMGADPPTLVVIGGRAVWRVPVYVGYPHVGKAGIVGTVDVDVETGEMNNTPERIEEFYRCAEKIGARQPPFRIRELPPEYRARGVPQAPVIELSDEEQTQPDPSGES